jgi:flagellar export protein FliJ
MGKYRFRLETLQKLRVAQRDQQRVALADAYRAEQILVDRRAALEGEMVELRDSQRAAMTGRYVDINQLVESQRYEMVLEAQQRQIAEQAGRLAVEVERRRQNLMEADRGVRVLDKLDERRRAEHRRQQDRWENKQLDEVASTRWHVK